MSEPIVSVIPIIHYPRKAVVGETYLMTIDLQAQDGYDWQRDWTYEEEEYPVYCAVDSNLFSSRVVGSPVILVHRFGGSYGKAKFLLTAIAEIRNGEIKVALINSRGVTIKNIRVNEVELVNAPIQDDALPDISTTIENLESHASLKSEGTYPEVYMGSGKTYPKVYISYTHDSQEQKDRVLDLADSLWSKGINCSIDQYEESPKDGWLRWMWTEIERADFVLIICTEKYLNRFRSKEDYKDGRFTSWEGGIIIQELFDGENTKFIPIIFQDEDVQFIPTPLRTTYYNVHTIEGIDLLYRRLTNQLKTTRPAIGEPLPVKTRKPFFSIREPYNLPRQPYNEFIGRNKELTELLHKISPVYRPYIIVVKGIGGVGKTSLVLEVAYQCLAAKRTMANNPKVPFFDAIIFTSSKSTTMSGTKVLLRPPLTTTLLDMFRVIAETLNEPTITQVAEENQSHQVKEVLRKYSTLLIVDSMETLSTEERNRVLEFLNDVPAPTKVIITTRDEVGFDGISLDHLSLSDSRRLVVSEAKSKKITITSSQRDQVCKRFCGIPIALIYAVGQRAAGYSFADILKPSVQLPSDLGKFCFDSSFEPLRESPAYKLLVAMTFFRDPPCRDALIKVAGLVNGTRGVRDGLAKLQQLSLIEEDQGRFTILSITRQYVRQDLEANENDDFIEAARERWLQWYLDFTKKFGGKDWENWRVRYDQLEQEWRNIESVLYWYAAHQDWDKVLELWEQLDGYVDLNGYWQKRRHWWSYLYKHSGRVDIQIKALSEGAWTSILMGDEYNESAEESLLKAWDLGGSASKIVQADVANHLAVLEKGKGNYAEAHKWLDREHDILQQCQLPERDLVRHQIQNLYYRAEVNQIDDRETAKKQLEQVIELCEQVGWQRFLNYAQNSLIDILIEEAALEQAENMLKGSLSFAMNMREIRRVALYEASYAKLEYALAQLADEGDRENHLARAEEYASRALAVFTKERMAAEEISTIELLRAIH
jgi:archaellum biogenesis ATPase FlaH